MPHSAAQCRVARPTGNFSQNTPEAEKSEKNRLEFTDAKDTEDIKPEEKTHPLSKNQYLRATKCLKILQIKGRIRDMDYLWKEAAGEG